MTMKRSILCFALFLIYGACRPSFAVPSACVTIDSAEQTEAESGIPATQTIRDQVEYNDYLAAFNTQDPVARAAKMEAFVDRYPESVKFMEALEGALTGHQQSGDLKKAAEIGKRVLLVDPNHVRALVVLAFEAQSRDKGSEAAKYAERGLRALPNWPKPPEFSEKEFSSLCARMARAFYSVAGFSALNAKDYAKARGYLLRVYEIGGAELQDVYRLAMAELEMTPMDIHGFWYLAKAMALAQAQNNTAGMQQIDNYGKAKYKSYHGDTEKWAALMASAEACGGPPEFRDDRAVLHGVPSSITSPTGDGVLHGVPSSVSSPTPDGKFHGVPASVSSPTPDGHLHGVAASVTSPQGDPTFSIESAARACEYVAFSGLPGPAGVIDGPSREANADALIPADFLRSIKRKPTPQELACRLVRNGDPDELSIADKELILSFRDAAPCNHVAADKVWAAILKAGDAGKAKFPLTGVKVIAAGKDFIDVAASEDRQQDNKADIHVRLDPAVIPPQPGEVVDVRGIFISYTPDPFMFMMAHGELDGPPKRPAKAAGMAKPR